MNLQPMRFSMNRRSVLMLFAGSLAAIGTRRAWAANEPREARLYKDPQCTCCEGYADYLRTHDFKVKVTGTHDLPTLNEERHVPVDLQGCHLTLVGGYFIGGHVPIKVVNRLLSEQPPVDGITLPGMPQGSPGMTGTKTAPFRIYEITKGKSKIYATV
jgi:hypothetical protein